MKKKTVPVLNFKRIVSSEPAAFEADIKAFFSYIEKSKGTFINFHTHITGSGKDKVYEGFIVYRA